MVQLTAMMHVHSRTTGTPPRFVDIRDLWYALLNQPPRVMLDRVSRVWQIKEPGDIVPTTNNRTLLQILRETLQAGAAAVLGMMQQLHSQGLVLEFPHSYMPHVSREVSTAVVGQGAVQHVQIDACRTVLGQCLWCMMQGSGSEDVCCCAHARPCTSMHSIACIHK